MLVELLLRICCLASLVSSGNSAAEGSAWQLYVRCVPHGTCDFSYVLHALSYPSSAQVRVCCATHVLLCARRGVVDIAASCVLAYVWSFECKYAQPTVSAVVVLRKSVVEF